ncbi:MAG: hypothetical protein C0399_07600 [Syntrophus sp. (in: bacteria)]|nr:hypothetical protein [Syntrophus sp. (in: bacteria)]
MEVFVVIDKMILGRGVLGAFSTNEKARVYMEEPRNLICNIAEIRRLTVIGAVEKQDAIFAAHNYDSLYDSYTFEGLYAKQDYALDAVGVNGLTIEFVVDMPESTKIIDKCKIF